MSIINLANSKAEKKTEDKTLQEYLISVIKANDNTRNETIQRKQRKTGRGLF
jgi:hypothetical protein